MCVAVYVNAYVCICVCGSNSQVMFRISDTTVPRAFSTTHCTLPTISEKLEMLRAVSYEEVTASTTVLDSLYTMPLTSTGAPSRRQLTIVGGPPLVAHVRMSEARSNVSIGVLG